jgi:hypothetical protein
MSQNDLNELADDIRKNGLLHPITLMPDGTLLDGRSRWDACEIAGVEPRTTIYEGDDPAGFVISNNVQRRQLTRSKTAKSHKAVRQPDSSPTKSQKAIAIVRRSDLSRKAKLELAEQSGVSQALVDWGHSLLRKAEPHIIEMVAAGEIGIQTVNYAIRFASRDIQRNWTLNDVKREGSKSSESKLEPELEPKLEPKPKTKARVKTVIVPYGTCQFPTAEESGAPPPGSTLAEHDAFFERYGRVPLHPRTVADMLEFEARTAGLVNAIVSVANPRHPDAETFFAALDQMLAWVPERGQTNGTQMEFAKMGGKTLALLEKNIVRAVNLLTSIRLALEVRAERRMISNGAPPQDAAEYEGDHRTFFQ